MSIYRVLKSGVWQDHKVGDVVEVDGDMDFYLHEGIVEEMAVQLEVDKNRPQKVHLRVSDVHIQVGTTQSPG